MASLQELVNVQSSGALAFWFFILLFIFTGIAGMVVGLLRRIGKSRDGERRAK